MARSRASRRGKGFRAGGPTGICPRFRADPGRSGGASGKNFRANRFCAARALTGVARATAVKAIRPSGGPGQILGIPAAPPVTKTFVRRGSPRPAPECYEGHGGESDWAQRPPGRRRVGFATPGFSRKRSRHRGGGPFDVHNFRRRCGQYTKALYIRLETISLSTLLSKSQETCVVSNCEKSSCGARW